MALGFDDILEGAVGPTILAGIGLAVAAQFLMGGSRTAAKKVVHAYLDMADKLKESSSESRERWADFLAEVYAEREARAAALTHQEGAPGEAAT
jgi:cellobiose phosphorylase